METYREQTHRYRSFRDSYRLQKRLWQQEVNGTVYACALGALLNVDENSDQVISEQLQEKTCAATTMPQWLLDLTPAYFDYDYDDQAFHFKWADALYLPGGLIDRANDLTTETRTELYENAKQEIKRRYSCQLAREGIDNAVLHESFGGPGNMLSYTADKYAAAGTIILVLDQLLTEAGV